MCGIAGIMTAPGQHRPSDEVLRALAQAMAHRGPDGDGVHRQDDVALVHTRLAIIDLQTGDQPLFAEDGCALVANGEIYNYLELREQLPGVKWRSHSDCEPPLELYRRHGLDYASQLRGMFAIAIHDPKKGRLVLTRDPFGIKPLYYVENAQGFAFASEPQALIAAGLAGRSIRREALLELLQLQFTTGGESIFQGIQRLLPGETIAVEKGRIVARQRLDALPRQRPREIDADRALSDFDRVISDSVSLHQRSDVPYGMFLSGGIDSSVLLAMMSRLNPNPVLAFTAGFSGTNAHDERTQAREMAEHLRARHVEVDFTEDDFWQLLPQVAAAMDDPAADYAILPTFKLAQVAQRDVKVVLSGEGGDELFAGYGRYRSAMRPWPLTKSIRRSGTFDGLGILREPPAGWRGGIGREEARIARLGLNRLQRAQALDCADWLPHDLLTKLDRCLMANHVEGRVPFLDPMVAQFAFTLPDHLKIRKRLGKWLVRKWLETGLPAAKPFARKRGFTVPVGEWIARQKHLGELLARQPAITELCRPGSVAGLCRNADKANGFAAWTLLFYALWHRRHIENLPAEGSVFDLLAAR